MATVKDLITGEPFSVEPSTTVAEAATMMAERRIGSALVMEGEKLLGIFTERDVLRAMGEQFDAAQHPVSEWMTHDPIVIDPGADAKSALETMLERNFRHLPVVDGGAVLGVVSMRDLTAAEAAD
ncbi:MAG: CBS domain-containing protein [Actinomycetota bacterium]